MREGEEEGGREGGERRPLNGGPLHREHVIEHRRPRNSCSNRKGSTLQAEPAPTGDVRPGCFSFKAMRLSLSDSGLEVELF